MSLIVERKAFKPFQYPWAFEAWQKQQQLHWLPEEVPMADDVRDWKYKLNDSERHLLTQIFRFFVQADVEVNNCYMKHYMKIFKPVEIQMMLSAFSNMETVHAVAYSYLLDTIGMPETEYEAFLHYKEMKDKYDYMKKWNTKTPEDVMKTLAVFGGFTEGVQLFASFAMLLNFTRFNKMKGMGQIITWSVRDETLHTNSILKLLNEYKKEFPQAWNDKTIGDIVEAAKTIVEYEDAFIDLAFEAGELEGLTSEEVKKYIRYITDRRLNQMGIDKFYVATKNPLPWMDEILNGVEHANFFEARSTEYSKAATKGSWDEVFV